LRIGTYRALIDLDEEAHILWVRHLDHRKRIYRRD
jgi:mRNA-degrading endonuclease RelE of RelBE toxin-antitoxin system